MKIKLGLGKVNMTRVAAWCSGELYDFTGDAGCDFEYVCTDSREADANTMFVATRGERVDGHDYIISAIDRGCRCILCEYVPTDIGGRRASFVVVENCFDAFALTARGYRAECALDTVAITGSVGKTTTKELCAAIIGRSRRLYYTEGNFNSIIGMPMSLMAAGRECDSAVFEMGMSGFGEILSMTLTARPRVAMVTNIGSSHLEYLKTRENIARAKLEIAEGLCEGGYLLLNGDEPLLRSISPKNKDGYSTVFVGIDAMDCQVRASNVRVGESHTTFDLVAFGREYKHLGVNLVGSAFVYNASFAVAAAILMGADEDAIRRGLADYTPVGMRQRITERDGVRLIIDCYNAAPESMRCAIDALAAQNVSGAKIAVLGDMRELGDGAERLHRELGTYVCQRGVDLLLTLGELGKLIGEGAIAEGMVAERVISEADIDNPYKLTEFLKNNVKEGDAVLFKASRSVRLERVADTLLV